MERERRKAVKRADKIAAMQGALGLYGFLAEHIVDALEARGFIISPKRKIAARRPVGSDRCDSIMAEGIRQYAERNPAMTQAQIGAAFNVNQGRVSEALAYKR